MKKKFSIQFGWMAIALALDNIANLEELATLAKKFAGKVGFFKVGLETITKFGTEKVIAVCKEKGMKVFYDGKWDDIPNTTKKTAEPVADWNADMINVHASSGSASISAAADSKGNAILLAVTVLTSIDDEECKFIFGDYPEAKVVQLAEFAARHGADGVICSPKELAALNANPATADLIKVTPGIQPEWMQGNDQKRVMTPGEAIKAGADILVIGRAITQPSADGPAQGDSLKAAQLIAEEIDEALRSLKA